MKMTSRLQAELQAAINEGVGPFYAHLDTLPDAQEFDMTFGCNCILHDYLAFRGFDVVVYPDRICPSLDSFEMLANFSQQPWMSDLQEVALDDEFYNGTMNVNEIRWETERLVNAWELRKARDSQVGYPREKMLAELLK